MPLSAEDMYFASHRIPPSRIATFDVYAVARNRNHISAILEYDVTDLRKRLRELKRAGKHIAFTAWVLKAISLALEKHPEAAAYKKNKKKLITFRDINISLLVEKEINGKKVPIPLIIEKVNEKTAMAITAEIEAARAAELNAGDITLHSKTGWAERVYYILPAVLRKLFWSFLLRRPHLAFSKMGNVAVSSLSMLGRLNGWFIHRTVHPLSFGVGSVIRKPVVHRDEIRIREILNMTVLIDHDVIDGAPMVRFMNDLTRYLENADDYLL